MQIYPEKLAQHFQKSVAPIYLITGDEPLLIQEACDTVRASLKERGYLERELHHAETGFDWSSLLYSANSMSLFAEKKLVEVRATSAKPNDAAKEVMLQISGQANEDTVFLFVMPKIDKNTMRAKWYKALDNVGVHVPIWPIEGNRLGGWLNARFKMAGLQASREVVDLMMERIEGNLLAAVQEIERLKLISTNSRIEVNDVLEGVADSARYDIFKLLDVVQVGDSVKAVRMLQGLRNEGVETLFIVNMLMRQLRSLETMRGELDSGQSMQAVLKKNRIWQKQQAVTTRCLERHSLDSLRSMIVATGQIDRMVKGLEIGDPWRALGTVLLSLSSEKPLIHLSA